MNKILTESLAAMAPMEWPSGTDEIEQRDATDLFWPSLARLVVWF
ncbi:hypothetical protein [Microvirga sp.]|nr:hypothetical protein [Microvirga sp.]